MPKVFLHKQTRVMKRCTLDTDVQPAPDEIAVDITFNPDLRRDGKYWKLSQDGTQTIEATQQEIIDSHVDIEIENVRRQAIMNQIQALIADMALHGATPPKLSQYFNLLQELMA